MEKESGHKYTGKMKSWDIRDSMGGRSVVKRRCRRAFRHMKSKEEE
jgi:hypothetical protein